MKKYIICLAAIAAFAACKQEDVKVDNPPYVASNTNTIDIARVEINDSATVIDVDAKYRPNYWIKIASGTTLEADGKEYKLVGAEGIEPDSLFWMPESGEASFKLVFEPMPKSTKAFDFVEGDAEGAFRIWGVDVSGISAADFYAKEPEGMRKALKNAPQDIDLASIKPGVGTVKVNMHMLNYKPEMGNQLSVYVNEPLLSQEEYTATIDSAGLASISVPVYGAEAYLMPVYDSRYGLIAFSISPADSVVNAYLDMRVLGARNKGDYMDEDFYNNVFTYTDGVFSPLNALPPRNKYLNAGLVDYDKPYYAMTGDVYAAEVYSGYEALLDSIDARDVPAYVKDDMRRDLNEALASAILYSDNIARRSYWNAHQAWGSPVPKDSIKLALAPEQVGAIGKYINFDDSSFPMSSNFRLNANTLKNAGLEAKGIENVKIAIQPYLNKLQNAELTDADIAAAAALTPDYAEFTTNVLTTMRQRQIEAMENATVKPAAAPDVPLAKLFEAIVAPYKGKVVMVDFWNTWCGPCRSALKANEPLKATELNDEDLVFVYIANESSPMAKYLTMIPDIKGVHYRLNSEQWEQLTDKDFDLDGIPSYVLVERSGKATLRNDLRDHSLYIKTVKEALAAK